MINKLLGVVLAFILLVFGPLTIYSLSQDLGTKRSIMNEMTNFIDKVTDTGQITDLELGDFYLGVASYGASCDVVVERYVRVVNPDGVGGTYTTYMPSDNIKQYNKGDVLKVTVKAIDYTGPQRVLWSLLKLAQPKFETTLSGMIRK